MFASISKASQHKYENLVFPIKLGAADPHLLLYYNGAISENLPTLATLRDNGRCRILQTFRALADDTIWASITTEPHPGKHGRYPNIDRNAHGKLAKYHITKLAEPSASILYATVWIKNSEG